MFVIKFRKIFYAFSAIIIAVSAYALISWGLNLGIDFKGGTIIEANYPNGRPEKSQIDSSLASMNLSDSIVRASGDKEFIIRTKALAETERKSVEAALTIGSSTAEITRFDSVGPVLGRELQGKAIWSILLVMLAIVLFITFVFRKVSEPVASWKYGAVAVMALIHDVIVPVGVFAFMGHFAGYEADALFVTALLVVLGFSVHDTIVVFDRTRENLKHAHHDNSKKSFEQIVGESVSQTFVRSINTSLTTVLALIALFLFGPETTKDFSLVLIIGIIAGTYSSIFIGSPLLVTIEKLQSKKGK